MDTPPRFVEAIKHQNGLAVQTIIKSFSPFALRRRLYTVWRSGRRRYPTLKINLLCFSSHREPHMARLIN